MDWDFYTHGWAYNMVHPGLARNHVPSRLLTAHTAGRPGPLALSLSGPARPAHRHAPSRPTHRAQASLAQYGSASGCARLSQPALARPRSGLTG